MDSSATQLRAATQAGYPTELVIFDEELDARSAMRRREPIDAAVTYLVMTRTHAQIVWGSRLADTALATDRSIVGKWATPYLREGDLDTALKAFVFGYLQALHQSERIAWEQAIVPFLPPGSSRRSNRAGGVALALIVALIVAKASDASV
jgi:hypothetical protein